MQDVEDAPDPDSNSTNTRGSRDVSRASRGSRDVDPDDVEAPPDANIAIEAGSIGSNERDDRASSAVSFSSARRTTFALPEDKTHHCFISHKKAHTVHGSEPGQVAKNIHDSLELLGFASWFDIDALKEISKDALRDGITGCVTMVVLLNDDRYLEGSNGDTILWWSHLIRFLLVHLVGIIVAIIYVGIPFYCGTLTLKRLRASGRKLVCERVDQWCQLIEVMRESETTCYLLGCLPATPATLATTCALCLVSLLPYASLL